MRRYPAIEFTWAARPDEPRLERLLASFDHDVLTAIDDQVDTWRAFFSSAEARDAALADVTDVPDGATVRAVDVADEAWAERSQAAIDAVIVGRLAIAPPWRADAATRAAGVDHVIIINPSMGFGTGHHASTRRCLALLQELALDHRSVVDVGTGSGVLALAAWRLGAAAVDAIDGDADAIGSAEDNLARNGTGDAVRLVACDLSAFDPRPGGYDVILANLTGATLERAATRLAALGREGSSLVASGVESHEAAAVSAALATAGWREVSRDAEDGWVGMRFDWTATSPTGSIDS